MSTLQTRNLLFLLGCIPFRLSMVYLAYHSGHSKSPVVPLPYLGYLALLPAIGFTLIYAFGWRKQGPETFGQPIWWNALRPIHGLLYFLFAYQAAIQHDPGAWRWLLVDVAAGLGGFVANRWMIR